MSTHSQRNRRRRERRKQKERELKNLTMLTLGFIKKPTRAIRKTWDISKQKRPLRGVSRWGKRETPLP